MKAKNRDQDKLICNRDYTVSSTQGYCRKVQQSSSTACHIYDRMTGTNIQSSTKVLKLVINLLCLNYIIRKKAEQRVISLCISL